MSDKIVFVRVVAGVEGPSLTLGGQNSSTRIAGTKPWGGGSTAYEFKFTCDELRKHLDEYEGCGP